MKKVLMMMLLASATFFQNCAADDEETAAGTSLQDNTGSTASSATTTSSDVATFDVAINRASLSEQESIPADDNDYVENTTFTKSVGIVFSDGGATFSGDIDGTEISVEESDGDVVVRSTTSAFVAYTVTGSTTDGSLKIYSDKKFRLELAGLSIQNPTGAAINIQSKKRVFVVLASGTTNTLQDGTAYADADGSEDMKACFFSEGQLCFSGTGSLSVTGNCKAGIRSDDYVTFRPGVNIYVKTTAGNGIKGNDAVNILGGVINVETSATAAKAISTDGHLRISGGRTTAIVTGGATYDTSEQDVVGSAGLKADSTLTISGGEVCIKNTGAGGKGISTDMQTYLQGGTVSVITTGKTYSYSGRLDSKAKGIKSDGNLVVSGGTVRVRATGGDGSEGIESKGTISIEGGNVQVLAYDDAINAASHLYIKGGNVYARSTGNDGLDSNGNTYIQGGTTVVYGTKAPECGIDANEEDGYTVYFTGGSLFAVGGGNSVPTNSNSTQGYVAASGSFSAGSAATIASGSQTLATFSLPDSYSNGSILVTAQGMTAGNSYTLTLGSATASLTAVQYGSSGMGGGAMPGGGNGRVRW